MEVQELLATAAELCEVAGREWLRDQTYRFTLDASLRHSSEARSRRLTRLARITARMEQVAEVDARIALLEATPHLPNATRLVGELRSIRARLVLASKA